MKLQIIFLSIFLYIIFSADDSPIIPLILPPGDDGGAIIYDFDTTRGTPGDKDFYIDKDGNVIEVDDKDTTVNRGGLIGEKDQQPSTLFYYLEGEEIDGSVFDCLFCKEEIVTINYPMFFVNSESSTSYNTTECCVRSNSEKCTSAYFCGGIQSQFSVSSGRTDFIIDISDNEYIEHRIHFLKDKSSYYPLIELNFINNTMKSIVRNFQNEVVCENEKNFSSNFPKYSFNASVLIFSSKVSIFIGEEEIESLQCNMEGKDFEDIFGVPSLFISLNSQTVNVDEQIPFSSTSSITLKTIFFKKMSNVGYPNSDDGSGDGKKDPIDLTPNFDIDQFLSSFGLPISILGIGIILFFFLICVLLCVCFMICKKIKKSKKEGEKQLNDDIDRIDKEEVEREMMNFKVNEDLFKIDFKEIEIVKSIGKGGFCKVFLGKYQNMEVAFKLFKTEDLTNTRDFTSFEKEIELMSSLRHKGLINFYGGCFKFPRIGIVMEYCSNGCISSYMKKCKVNIHEKLRMLKEITNVMTFLHKKNVIHRDLKPENILLDFRLNVKVCDFGLSRIFETSDDSKTFCIGTSAYMAPEIVIGDDYDEKVDVFAFGIIVYAIITNNFQPYSSSFNIQLKVAQKKLRPDIKKYPENIKKEYPWLYDDMINCWNHDPEKRPSFEKLFQNLSNCMKEK